MNSLSIKDSKNIIKRAQKPDATQIIVTCMAVGSILLIAMVISSLFIQSEPSSMLELLRMQGTWNAIGITVLSVILSLCVTAIIGVPTAFFLSQKAGRFMPALDMILGIPMVLPPSITGLALLMTFGRHGILGGLLSRLSLELPFTLTAVVIVQVFVSLPFFVQILKNAFLLADASIAEAAMMCGAGLKDLIFRIYLPMNKKAFVSACIMACLRSAGEFGATIMFAGNLEGKTQTISTAIYSLTQQDVTLAVLHIVIFLLPLMLVKTFAKE